MGNCCVGEQDDGDGRSLSVVRLLALAIWQTSRLRAKGVNQGLRNSMQKWLENVSSLQSAVQYFSPCALMNPKLPGRDSTYFSISFSFATSNVSSQPTSIRTLTPPSSSSRDCDALDSDWAPCKGVKVNILPSFSS